MPSQRELFKKKGDKPYRKPKLRQTECRKEALAWAAKFCRASGSGEKRRSFSRDWEGKFGREAFEKRCVIQAVKALTRAGGCAK